MRSQQGQRSSGWFAASLRVFCPLPLLSLPMLGRMELDSVTTIAADSTAPECPCLLLPLQL